MKLTDTVLQDMLATLIATGNTLDPAALWVGVATAIVDAGGATVMADVTPPTGAPATRVPIGAWVGPYKMNDGRWAVDGPPARFTPASSAEGAVLTHAYLADALVAGGLVGFTPVLPNLTLVDQTSKATVVIRITLDPNGRWDASVAWNG